MYLPYNKNIINDRELTPDNFNCGTYVGYISPLKAIPIEYNNPFGIGGHDTNFYTSAFNKYFIKRYYDCYMYGDKKIQDEFERNTIESRMNDLIDNLNSKKDSKEFNYRNSFYYSDYEEVYLRMYQFFYNCYSNGLFSEGYGKEILFVDSETFEEQNKNSLTKIYGSDYSRLYDAIEYEYKKYVNSKMLDIIKETYIQYLGLHSVERVRKTITTSDSNIYETFYNYLLNDYTIFQIPKMVFDEKKKKYVEYNTNRYFLSSKEQKLKSEIESIKKLVKVDDRYKYYRD